MGSGGEANFASDHFTDYFANSNSANLNREVKKASLRNEQRPEGQYVSGGPRSTTIRTTLDFGCQKLTGEASFLSSRKGNSQVGRSGLFGPPHNLRDAGSFIFLFPHS